MSAQTPSPRSRAGLLRRAGFAAALLVALSAMAAPSLAQDGDDPTSSRSEAFEAAEGPNTENIPGGALMVGAYGAAFVLLLGYVASIGFRQARTARELASLRAEIGAAEARGPAGRDDEG